MENNSAAIGRYLPPAMREITGRCKDLEEIRLRTNCPVLLRTGSGSRYWTREGKPVIVTDEDVHTAVQLITAASVYALGEELRRGYVTLPGGHRVGLVGKAVMEGGVIRGQRDITSLNYRVARNVAGAGRRVLPYLFPGGQKLGHTLIVSPPGAGKTTLLRELAALLADGCGTYPPRNVAIVDERSEIAGTYLGERQLYVGQRTDVLDGATKGEGMMLMIRSMAPEVLITDEIGGEGERDALAEAINCGVVLLLSAHGRSRDELAARPVLRALLSEGVFDRYVFLSRCKGPGTLEGIYDAAGEKLC